MLKKNQIPDSSDSSLGFDRLLSAAQHELYAFICTLLINWEAADDVLQETNLKLMEHATEYDTTRPFLPWAKAFAYNQVRRYLKGKSRSRLVFDNGLLECIIADAESEEAAPQPELTLLERCLELLTPSQRKLIDKRYFEDQEIDAIAHSLQKTSNTIYVTLHRIRKLLARCIETYMPAPSVTHHAPRELP